MTPSELLAEVKARGGSVAVALDSTGAAMLKVTPRGIVPDLLPDLARFKTALLELLTQAPDARQLALEVAAATRGQWLTPTPALMAEWKRFAAHFAANLSGQQIGAIARLVDANELLDNEAMLVQIGALLRQGETT